MLKKGPEIKLSSLKVPGPVADVYRDLRDRHLLPLVALLVVAIVAVPIALSKSTEPEPVGGAEGAVATPSNAAPQSGQLVAEAAPGLRDYRRRLEHRDPHDPFVQKFAEKEKESGAGEGTSEPVEEGGGTPPTETEVPGPNGTPGPGGLIYYSYAIDVKLTNGSSQGGDAGGGTGKTTVRHNLPELTMLPGRNTPAVIYMGSTRDGKKALMLISSDVTSIFGDAKCVLGSQTCELLAMEPGLPETFVYGGAGRTFKIEILKIGLVETDQLNKAPLGKPKKGKGGG